MSDLKQLGSISYSPLVNADSYDPEISSHAVSSPSPKHRHLVVLLTCSALLNAISLVSGLLWWMQPSSYPHRGAIPFYTPIQDAISYEHILFNKLNARTKWHGPPTNAVDKAWHDLYKYNMYSIPKSHARLLPNRTVPFADDEENYVVAIDAFHQLHCLDTLRQALYPERYPMPFRYQNLSLDASTPLFDHVDHCVNALRESLMCNADTTATVWHWSTRSQMALPRFDVVHTCKRWDDLYSWAEKWDAQVHFDDKTLVVDDLKFPDDP